MSTVAIPSKIKLTFEQVAEAARKAIAENRLQCQVTDDRHACRYLQVINGQNIRCVIGSALTDEQAVTLDRRTFSSLRSLISAEIVETNDGDDLIRLQGLHDGLAGNGGLGNGEKILALIEEIENERKQRNATL
jgi:hypothetical protein